MGIINGAVLLLVLGVILIPVLSLWRREIDEYERSLDVPETSTHPDQETDL